MVRPGAWARWLLVALTAAAALLRLAQLGAADRQWTRFVRRRPRRFTSFEQVAQLSAAARGLAASLLFLLLVKVRAGPAGLRLGVLGQGWSADAPCPQAAQQLRFVRQWSVFSKTLCRALPELLGAALGLVTLAVAYAQLAVLVGDSGGLGGGLAWGTPLTRATFPSAGILLRGLTYERGPGPLGGVPQSWLDGPVPRGLAPVPPAVHWALGLEAMGCPEIGGSPSPVAVPYSARGALSPSLGATGLRDGGIVTAQTAPLDGVQQGQGGGYGPVGGRGTQPGPRWAQGAAGLTEPLCRPQFRHKVRFEGMEPLPSRSSRGSKSSPDVPPPTGDSDASRLSTSSSQLDGLNVGRPGPRGEPEPSRLQAVFEALLAQFDRLNQATEDVYQLERRLQSLHGRRTSRPPASPPLGPSTGLQPALPSRLARASRGIGLATGPSRASLRAKNKVHPSST